MVSFLFSTFIIWKYAKEEFKEEEYLDLFLYGSIVALICARVTYILFHFDDFGLNLLRYIVVRETPGLSLLGGLIGGFVYIYWQIKLKKYDLFHILNLFSIAASVGLFFAKIGEQLGGAGFGKETSSFLGVAIVGLTGKRHPTEIYEAIIYFFLSVLLIYLYKRVQRREMFAGTIFFIFAVVTFLNIFLVDFLKVCSIYLYGLSLRQVVSLFLLLTVTTPVLFKLIKKKVIVKI